MEKTDATALAALGRYIREYRAAARQLAASPIAAQWWKMRVAADVAAEWANLGYTPEDAAPLIADGITPATVREMEPPVSAVAVLREMYRANIARHHGAPFALLAEVHKSTARLLGLESDASDEAFDRIAPVAERAVDLMYAAAGIPNTGSDDTPAAMATTGRARDLIAGVVDVSDVRVVGPVDDERRLAHLVETTPDAD